MPASIVPRAENMAVNPPEKLKVFLVPCSCGGVFAVSADYDRHGSGWGRYLKCPQCGKRHDPKNRLLQLGYQRDGFWKVEEC